MVIVAIGTVVFAVPGGSAEPTGFDVDAYLSGQDVSGSVFGLADVKSSLDLGRDLNSQVGAQLQATLREFVSAFRAAIASDAEIEAVAALDLQYQKLKALHLLHLANMRGLEDRGVELDLKPRYQSLIESQRASYESRTALLFSSLDGFYYEQVSDPNSASEEAFFERFLSYLSGYADLGAAILAIEFWLGPLEPPRTPTLRNSTLPYGPLDGFVPGVHRAEPPITPSYELSGIIEDAEDLSASATAPFSDPLRLKAEELEYDPIKVFNFVKNEIRTEFYAGAAKGGEMTLLSGSGNDVDQASLLVALMRLSGIPARFVTGVVELPIEYLLNALSTDSEPEALRAMRLSGIPHEPVIQGGKVVAVLMERSWVTAKLPYSNYRGTIVDASGAIWLPLDASFKTLDPGASRAVLEEMGVDALQRVANYMTVDHEETLRDQLLVEVAEHLEQTTPELELEDLLAPAAIQIGDTGYLPTTLPYIVEQVNSESAALPDELFQEIRFQIHSGESASSPVVLDETFAVSDLYNRRVTISYIPATIDDHEVVRSFGGLTNTPAYLIQVRPQIKIGGQAAATAGEPMQLGEHHRLVATLFSLASEESVDKTLVSGSYHALALSMGDTVPGLDSEDDPTDEEFTAARILSQAALRYHAAWDEAENDLAAMAGVSLVRPLPAITFASNRVNIDFVLDQPQQLIWRAVELDATSRRVEAVATFGGSYPVSSWRRLSALEGSILEHHLFEEDFQVASVSADKVIALATEAGIEILTIDEGNAATEIPRLSHPTEIADQVALLVQQGLTVTIPLSPVGFLQWSGSAWFADDDGTGAAGYFLSGDLAGGITATAVGLDAKVVAALSEPYSPEANEDASSPAQIYVIGSSDGQSCVMGEQADNPLTVLVVDRLGRPVSGANVQFLIQTGNGTFGLTGQETIQTTSSSGTASAVLTCGTNATVYPIAIKQNLGDEFSTLALLQLVDVAVERRELDGSTGLLFLSAPIEVIGLPGEVDTLKVGKTSVLGTPAARVTARVEDEHGNNVANVEIEIKFDRAEAKPGVSGSLGDARVLVDGERKLSATDTTEQGVGARFVILPGEFGGGTTYFFKILGGGKQEEVEIGGLDFGRDLTLVVAPEFREADRAVGLNTEYPEKLHVKVVGYSGDFRVRSADCEESPCPLFIEELLTNKEETANLDTTNFTAEDNGSVIAIEELPRDSGDPQWNVSVKGGSVSEFMDVMIKATQEFEAVLIKKAGDQDVVVTETRTAKLDKPFERIAVLDSQITLIKPIPIPVNAVGGKLVTQEPFEASYLRTPVGYDSITHTVELLEGGVPIMGIRPDNNFGVGVVYFPRGIEVKPGRTYELRYVSRRGSPNEVIGEPVPLPISQKVLRDFQRRVKGRVDVDVLNNQSCEGPFTMRFFLNEEAEMNLSTSAFGGASTNVINGQVFPAGPHTVALDYDDFGEGVFDFTLTARSTATGFEDGGVGQIEVIAQRRDNPPVGHAYETDIDLFDGSLNLARTDFSLSGRGPPLELIRSYKSSSSGRSLVGGGWSHNFDASLVETLCGSVVAKGIPFFPSGEGFAPGVGHHSTLEKTEGGYDLYTKDGTRFRFREFSFDTSTQHLLEFIQDTNGNVFSLGYNPPVQEDAELAVVTDSSGRSLNFSYRWNRGRRVLDRIEGPDNFRATYTYDTRDRLSRVDWGRGTETKTESYEYVIPAPDIVADPNACDPDDVSCSTLGVPNYVSDAEWDKRHAIKAVNDAGGNRTEYTYETQSIFADHSLDGGTVQNLFVTEVRHPELGTTQFDYSERVSRTGELQTTVTDRRQKVTTHTLNQYGSPLEIAHPAGVRTLEWSASDIVIESDADENLVLKTLGYDAAGNVTLEQIADNPSVLRTYTQLRNGTIKNRLETQVGRNLHTTSFSYDQAGNLDRIDYPDGTNEQHVYAPNGDRLRTRDRNGNWTHFAYDEFGNLELVTDSLGNVTRNEWNIRGRKLATTDARGNTTRFAYDEFDRLTSIIDPLGGTRSFGYDLNDNQISETDEEGRLTTREYDDENRIIKIIGPTLDERTFAYDDSGNLETETDWRGNATVHEYDDAGRRTKLTEPEGRITQYAYDPAGNLTQETRQLGRVVKHKYDDQNRRIETEDGFEAKRTFEYDDEGNLILEVDELGREVRFEYDEVNRLRFQREPLGKTTEFRYDGNSNLIEVIDGNGNSTRKEYDSLNRVIAETDAEGNRSLFEYDAVGNPVREVDPRGAVTRHEYDELNRRIKTIDAEDSVFDFQFDGVGNLVEERWPNGNTITSEYDDLDRLLKNEDVLGRLFTNEYDENGNLTKRIDARGFETAAIYDNLNQLVEERKPEGRTTFTEYDLLGNVLKTIDGKQNEIRFEFDLLDRVAKEFDPLGNFTEYSYDAVGNLLGITDRRENETTHVYDDLNRLIEIRDPNGNLRTREFDRVGNLILEIDENGFKTESGYDKNYRVESITRADLQIVFNEYDESGNLLFVTDAQGNVVGKEYDLLNRLIQENGELSSIRQFTYDSMGNRTTQRDPEGRYTVWTFDERSQRLSETTNGTSPSNGTETTRFGYDASGNRNSVERPRQFVSTSEFDGAGRLVAIIDPNGGRTEYGYDFNDNRTSQINSRGHTTLFRFDVLDRMTAIEFPDGAIHGFTAYDDNGNLTQETKPNGVVVDYVYDFLDRETLRQFSLPAVPVGDDIQEIETRYDAGGNVVQVVERYHGGGLSDRVSTFVYDSLDRLVEVVDGFGKQIRYGYDANGNRIQLIDPDGKVTQYQYDALNRVAAVTNAAGVTTYSYDRSSRPTEILYPNNTRVSRFYDDAGRVSVIGNSLNGSQVSRFEYTYDENGNRSMQVESNGGPAETTIYNYDSLDRLVQVEYPDVPAGLGTTVEYGYDAAYNRVSENVVNSTTLAVLEDRAYTYNARNELSSIADLSDPNLNVSYSYDENGNQVQKTQAGLLSNYIFDARDRLRRVTIGGSTVGEFLYDHRGRRIEKVGDRGVERYSYDDTKVLTQFDAAGQTIAKFDYGATSLLSLDHESEGLAFYLTDVLGSVVGLTTISGTVQARYQYDAFGNPRGQSGMSWNRFGFTGHEGDDETGLIYAKARYYDADVGRFVSQDPLLGDVSNPPSLHRYSYAYANPTVFVDRDGRCAEPVSFLLCVAFLGAEIAFFGDLAVQEVQAQNPSVTGFFSEDFDGKRSTIAATTGALSGATGGALTLVGASTTVAVGGGILIDSALDTGADLALDETGQLSTPQDVFDAFGTNVALNTAFLGAGKLAGEVLDASKTAVVRARAKPRVKTSATTSPRQSGAQTQSGTPSDTQITVESQSDLVPSGTAVADGTPTSRFDADSEIARAKEPEVEEFARRFADRFPGREFRVERSRKNSEGKNFGIDFETDNAIVEMKSNTGPRLQKQLLDRADPLLNPTGKVRVGLAFSERGIGPQVKKGIEKNAGLAGSRDDIDDLLEILAE